MSLLDRSIRPWRLLASIFLVLYCVPVLAAGPLKPLKIRVGSLSREGLISVPANATKTECPLVFVFHGHSGTAQKAAERFAIHEYWPEALCVYLQGVPTPVKGDPEGKHSGWQNEAGEFGDRDLKFFDAVLAQMRQKFKVDDHRIYATGFSNGGFFTFLLWGQRGETFAALAACAAHAGKNRPDLKAKPFLHVAGENDPKVSLEIQQQTMEFVRKLNDCEDTGEIWNKPATKATATRYESKSGTPFVGVIHPGGHEVPIPVGGRIMARFFKEQQKS